MRAGRSVLRLVGLFLGVAGLVVVGVRLWSEIGELRWDRWTLGTTAFLLLLAGIYAAANILLASAWRRLLAHEGLRVPWRWAVRTYGLTQVAKYLPGNVFHFAGRQALGISRGLPGWALARASAWELGVVTVGGVLLGVAGAPWLFIEGGWGWKALGSLTFLGAIALGVRRVLGRQKAVAMTFAMMFLCVSSGLFIAVCVVVVPGLLGNDDSVIELGVVYVLAWLAGVLTPGAPAGMGVRELVLLGLLKDTLREADLLMAILLSRGVTILGDALLYLAVSVRRPDEKDVRPHGKGFQTRARNWIK